MNLYRCFMVGENFPGVLIGESKPVGFYTTRFVRAESPEEAESMALNQLRSDPKLDVDPSKRTLDARVFFESVDVIDAIPEGVNEAGTGYAFFVMGT